MRKALFIFLLLLPVSLFAQQSKVSTPVVPATNMERLGQDYEVKNIANPDPGLVESLDLDYYDGLREWSNDIEILDESTGYTLIIYSIERLREIELYYENNQPDTNSPSKTH